ncbi:MAG TPA: sigma-70 family RNA polymerase sigma factor [Caulobacteraceae bacterium]|jgi:RNA polymerase sigma-70 factor (ECF subfamily)
MAKQMRRGADEPGAAVTSRADPNDDARLLGRIAEGDARAFEALYRAYHPRLSRFIGAMLRRPHLVEEVLNDAMLVVWRKPLGYNGKSKVSTWILAIAYRRALKALSKVDDPVEDPGADARSSPEAGPEQQLARGEVRVALRAAMAELSPQHRAVVDLTYFHEAGYREIAEIMDCPVDTVKTRMFHARRRLKSKLAGQLADWL